MANPIPPLLCSTPPPIDFDEELSANNDTNDDFCEFDTGDTETFEGQSLPSTPKHLFHTINKKLDPDLETNCKTDVIKSNENIFYCEVSNTNIPIVLEDKSCAELSVKVLENSENDFSDIEKSSENEKSLDLVSSRLSESEECDFGNESKKNIKFNTTHDIEVCISDNSRPIEDCVENNLFNINSHDKKNDLSASNSETLYSITNNVNEISTDNINAEPVKKLSNIMDNVSNIMETDPKTIVNISNIEENITIYNLEDENISIQENISKSDVKSQSPEIQCDENEAINFTFEADFSQFQSFHLNETASVDQLNESKIALVETNIIEPKQKINLNNSFDEDDDADDFEKFQNYASETVGCSDDDDFDEFTEFKEASPPMSTEIFNNFNSNTHLKLQENIKTFLDTMFPTNDSINDCNISTNIQNSCQKMSICLKSVDSAEALNFQWSSSTIKHSLVKAIGIDSRNILHGEKWNSSMPRFAANLGFNPLEPLKPVKLEPAANTVNFLENIPNTSADKVVTNRIEVPAVEFDWNTAGLVNPLDGIKEIVHENKTETVHPASPGELQESIQQLSKSEQINSEFSYSEPIISDDTKSIANIQDEESNNTTEYLSTFDTNLNVQQEDSITQSNNLENIKNLERLTYTNYQSNENINISTSSAVNSNTFIVPLKETHIFTPSKGDTAVSRSTTNISESTANVKCVASIDFDYEIAAAGTVIDETVIKKEYRDIEYNPNKFIINSDAELGDYQNLTSTENADIKEESLNELSNASSEWNSYNNIVKSDSNNIYDFDNTIKNKDLDTNLRTQLSIDTTEDFGSFQKSSTVGKYENFSKPTIGLSPTENIITMNNRKQINDNKHTNNISISQNSCVDDDFTDFQFVPPSSTLVTNTFQTISNSNSLKTVDNEKNNRTNILDQMILSPAILLPQTVQINSQPKIDWPEPGIDSEELARIETLFPSSRQNNFPNQSINSLHRTQNENTNILSVNNDDDWSDFISASAINTHENNLNTIYCPTSPTKVAKSIPITSEFNNDDEWSDFISSTPTTNNSEYYNKITLHNNPAIAGKNISQQSFKNMIPNPININSNNDQTLINNKFSKYLLNNGNIQSKGTMHLNSNKSNDFISQYQPKQDIINQQNLNKNQLNHHKISPSISLIPDLGYVAPQNFISIPKKNFQKK